MIVEQELDVVTRTAALPGKGLISMLHFQFSAVSGKVLQPPKTEHLSRFSVENFWLAAHDGNAKTLVSLSREEKGRRLSVYLQQIGRCLETSETRNKSYRFKSQCSSVI